MVLTAKKIWDLRCQGYLLIVPEIQKDLEFSPKILDLMSRWEAAYLVLEEVDKEIQQAAEEEDRNEHR